MTRQLENAYLEEETPAARATEKANRAGMQALVTGLKREQNQTIVMSGNFASLLQAIEAVNKAESYKKNDPSPPQREIAKNWKKPAQNWREQKLQSWKETPQQNWKSNPQSAQQNMFVGQNQREVRNAEANQNQHPTSLNLS